MSNLITSIGSNVVFPISATVPATLEEGTFCLVVNSTVGRELYVGDASNNPVPACGYRQYVASLTQTGTNAPVATVLKNTLGGTVVFSYSSAGTYSATLANAFPSGKSYSPSSLKFIESDGSTYSIGFIASRNTNDEFTLQTYDWFAADGVNGYLADFLFEIYVYV